MRKRKEIQELSWTGSIGKCDQCTGLTDQAIDLVTPGLLCTRGLEKRERPKMARMNNLQLAHADTVTWKHRDVQTKVWRNIWKHAGVKGRIEEKNHQRKERT